MSTSGLPVYNVVVDYSADPDGATDSSTAIQNAINAAAVNTGPSPDRYGGIVFIPQGTYKVSASLELKSNVRIVGEAAQNGIGVVLKPSHGDNHQPVFKYISSGAYIYGWSIENIAIDFSNCRSSPAPSTHTGDVGIEIAGCYLYDIQNVSVSFGYRAYNAYLSSDKTCFMGTVRKLYAQQCRNGIRHSQGTTMVFDSCWVNANQDAELNSSYWKLGWDLSTIYGVTLTSCALEKWMSGDSPAIGFKAVACRGLVINSIDVEGNNTNEGTLVFLDNCDVALNAFRTTNNTIKCANSAVSALVKAYACSLSISGSAFGGDPKSEPDLATGGNGSSEAVTLLLDDNPLTSAASIQGCHITPPNASGGFSGTRTGFKDETNMFARSLAVLGTNGIDNQLRFLGEFADVDYASDAARGYRVLVASTERVKVYGTGNNTNHGGRQQLIDGGVVGAGLRIGTAGDPSYALHLTSDSAAKPSTSTWTVTSDARTKDNVRDFQKGLDVIRQVVLQTWEYNGLGDTPAGQTASGVLAQEIEPFLPDAVVHTRLKHSVGDSDEAEFLGVNYHLLLLSALNAIKELDARLTALENAQ